MNTAASNGEQAQATSGHEERQHTENEVTGRIFEPIDNPEPFVNDETEHSGHGYQPPREAAQKPPAWPGYDEREYEPPQEAVPSFIEPPLFPQCDSGLEYDRQPIFQQRETAPKPPTEQPYITPSVPPRQRWAQPPAPKYSDQPSAPKPPVPQFAVQRYIEKPREPASEPTVRKKPKLLPIIIAAISGAVAVAIAVTVLYFVFRIGAGGKIESGGFASPEDAVRAYLEAFSNADVEGMISAFAVETYVENYNLEEMILRLGAYVSTEPVALPPSNDLLAKTSIYIRQGKLTDSIKMQYLTIFLKEKGQENLIAPFDDSGDALDLVRKLGDPANLEILNSLRVMGFIKPGRLVEAYDADMHRENVEKQLKYLGADALESVVARVDIDSQVYLFCFDTARYGGKWYISSFTGNIGYMIGISAYSGGVILESELP